MVKIQDKNSILYQHFLRSPQAAHCENKFYVNLDSKFIKSTLSEIRKYCGDGKKSIFLEIAEPHYYPTGSSVSEQFSHFVEACKEAHLFNADFFVPTFGSMFHSDFNILNKNYHSWNFIPFHVDLPRVENEKLDNSGNKDKLSLEKVKYKFLHMNFTHRLHRQLFSKFLLKEHLIEGNCVNIHNNPPPRMINPPEADKMKYFNQNDQWMLNKNLLDLWRDTELKTITNNDIDGTHSKDITLDYSIDTQFVKKAGFFIITETVFNYPHPHVSEKTLMALLSMRPFVIIGASGTLRTLKEKGFKTFDGLIDESYDSISDHNERMENIFKVVKNINNKPLDQIKQNVLQCEDKLMHNRQHLMYHTKKLQGAIA